MYVLSHSVARPPVLHCLPEMPSNHLTLCCPLLLLPSIFPSIKVFSSKSVLISFRIDWFDLLAVQGPFKSLLQHHNSKASILWGSAFLMDQLSYSYMTTGKTIALNKWTFVGKVMSLLFNMLSRLVIAFLPRSKHPLISWLQSPSAVTLKPHGWQHSRLSCPLLSPRACSNSCPLNW